MTRTPSREELAARVDRANVQAWIILPLQCMAALILGYLIDWMGVVQRPILPVIACALMLGPALTGTLHFWAGKKKNIEELKEQTRFGPYDKHQLRSLFQDTLRRLKLPDHHIRVYVTAQKTLNAGALRTGLGNLFPSLNGVFLNRQVLHKLEPAEIQDLMGHELGHYYRYSLVSDRFRWATLILGTLAGIYIVQRFGISDYIGPIVMAVIAGGVWRLANRTRSRLAQSIEYLCDDMGAQVHGLVPSINGLLKIGSEAEMMYAVHRQLLQTGRSATTRDLSADLEAIEAALPYGHISKQELKELAEKTLRKRAHRDQRPSMRGFLSFIWQSDDDKETHDELSVQTQQIAMLPRLPWESLLEDPTRIALTHAGIGNLVSIIEQYPDHVLFHLPDVFTDEDDSHPPLKSRILFLWQNSQDSLTRS